MEPIVSAKKTVKWTLNFTNLDIGKLSKEDLFQLWTEIRKRVYGEQGPTFIPDVSLVDWEERRIQAKEIQDTMRKFLEVILENGVSQLPQKYFPGKPTTEEPLNSPLEKSILFSIPLEVNLYRINGKVFAFPTRIEDKLSYDFLTALSYFPINLIQKCRRENCGGYFLATQQEKQYCSSKCAWRQASKRHYKLQPELVKEKRKEYYRRIKMVSFGPGGKKVEAGNSKDERR